MVNIICSEWIPSENIPFKIGIFIDWKVARLPPGGGGRLGRLWDDDYVFLPYYAVCGVKTVKVMGGWRLYL